VVQRKGLIADVVIERLPGIPLEHLANDLRHQLEGGGNTGDKAKLGQMDGIVLTGSSQPRLRLA
jgi:hypothetical protein